MRIYTFYSLFPPPCLQTLLDIPEHEEHEKDPDGGTDLADALLARAQLCVVCLNNLPALFQIQVLRIEVPVHAVPLQALAVFGRNALARGAAGV